MKNIFSILALWFCFTSVFGQIAIPDTIFIYETVTVYDTIVIRDTIRIKKTMDMPVLQPKSIDANNISTPPPATFSENRIILYARTLRSTSENNKYHKQKNIKTMKLNISSYLSGAILTAQSLSGLSAQESKPEDDLQWFPIQFSFVYPMTTQGNKTVNYQYSLSFNLLSGKVGAVTGVEFGGLLNHAEWTVQGVQFAGLANRTCELTGIQFGGLANTAHDVTGIQFGGLVNNAKTVTGIQFGGIANITETVLGGQFGGIANICHEATGAQFAGIANLSEYTKGAQFAGIANVSEKSEGAQFAGIANISKEVSGVSFGGILNRTGTLQGAQFGLINVIDTIENGVSIALINIVKKGFYREWSLNFADYLNVGLSYKMGIQKFYTILTAGANFMEDKLWVSGIGFGNRTVLNRRFDFQPEIVTYQYYPQNFKNIQQTSATHLKFGFICKLNDRFGLVVAPSLYFLNVDVGETMYKISPIPSVFEFETKNSGSEINSKHRHSFGAGICVGLILR